MARPLEHVGLATLLYEVKKRGYNPVKINKVYTTGQISKMCRVAPRTVAKWCDSGRLKSFRIPVSRDRRVYETHLIEFLKEHEMPLDMIGAVTTDELAASAPVVESTYGEVA